MDDACERFDAECQMVYLQSEDGNIGEEVANFNSAIAAGANGIATTIYDATSFDGPIDDALSQGINVIGYNIDDETTPNNRQAFIGQSLEQAGYDLMVDLNKRFFPKDGPLNILVGVNAPGQYWSEARTGGEIRWIEEFAANNPDREVNYDALDVADNIPDDLEDYIYPDIYHKYDVVNALDGNCVIDEGNNNVSIDNTVCNEYSISELKNRYNSIKQSIGLEFKLL